MSTPSTPSTSSIPFNENIGTLVGSGKTFGQLRAVVAFDEKDRIPPLGAFLIIETPKKERLVARVEHKDYTDYHTSASRREESLVVAYLQRLGKYGHGQLSEEEKKALFFTEMTLNVLGRLQLNNGSLEFLPSLRFLPPLTSLLRYPTKDELSALLLPPKEQAAKSQPVKIGDFALGERTFNDFPILFSPARFDQRRTAVFAQTGYGKSNLTKVVVSLAGWAASSGMLILDLDGEYTRGKVVNGQPSTFGLADIPFLHPRLVVFSRQAEALRARYPSLNIHGLLDLEALDSNQVRRLVESVEPERSTVKDLSRSWEEASKEVKAWLQAVERHQEAYNKPQKTKAEIREAKERENKAFNALLNQLVTDKKFSGPLRRGLLALKALHQRTGENAVEKIKDALKDGQVVIVDLSGWPLDFAWAFSESLMWHILVYNLGMMAYDKVHPVIAVIEEAQNVLHKDAVSRKSTFVRWAKEGRKLGLGLIYVTQQPGAIAEEIVTQTDNFFVMHLLSKVDTGALVKANPKFGGATEQFILGEPIRGNAYVYSAPAQPFVFPLHVLHFQPENIARSLGLVAFKWDELIDRLNKKKIEEQTGYRKAVGLVNYTMYEMLSDLAKKDPQMLWPGWVDHKYKRIEFSIGKQILAYLVFGKGAFPALPDKVKEDLRKDTRWQVPSSQKAPQAAPSPAAAIPPEVLSPADDEIPF